MIILPYETIALPECNDNVGFMGYMNYVENWVTVQEDHHGHNDCSQYGVLQPVYCKGFPGVVWKDVMS